MTNMGVETGYQCRRIGVLRDFVWNLSANVSYNKNEIKELYNGVQEYELPNTSTKWVVGRPLGEFYINRYAGVNPANGDPSVV